MTPDYAKMPDGELSAAVAEKVAGFKWWTGWYAGDNKDGAFRFISKNGIYADGWRKGKRCREDQMGLPDYGGEPVDLPPYATSADAIIELLLKTGWAWWEMHYLGARAKGLFRCDLSDGKGKYFRAYAPTFARSACLALLAAHEGKKP